MVEQETCCTLSLAGNGIQALYNKQCSKEKINQSFKQKDEENTHKNTSKKPFEGEMLEVIICVQKQIKKQHGDQELSPSVHVSTLQNSC